MLRAIQTVYPSKFNHGATTFHIMNGRHPVLDARGKRIMEVAYNEHHALSLYLYRMNPLKVKCNCWIHQGQAIEPTRHEVAIAYAFWSAGEIKAATYKTRTIIDLMLAGI